MNINQKRKTRILLIIIIIVIVLILLTGGAFAYFYFATDTFKGDKELFFKYMSQATDEKKGFINTELNQFFEKRNSVPFNNMGEFSVNISDSRNEEKYKNVNNFKVEFQGQVDGKNKSLFQNVGLKYSDDVNFQLNFKQIGDKYGIQANDIGSKFIAIDIKDLSKIASSNMTVNDYVGVLGKVNEVGKIQTDKEKVENVLNKYISILNDELNPELFSKVQDQDQEGYKLSLEGENLKNILVKLLENLKSDQEMLDKINETLKMTKGSSKITLSDIEDTIKNIQNSSDFDNKHIEISVYKNNDAISKISLSVDDTIISISKQQDRGTQKFEISLSEKDNNTIKLNITYEGLQSIQNIKETYEFEISSEDHVANNNTSNIEEDFYRSSSASGVKYKYTFINDLNFTDLAEIEDFTDENSVILTNYGADSISNFLGAVVQRVIALNKRDMEKLGLQESENPILQMVPSTGFSMFSVGNMGNINDNMSELEVNTFNTKFEVYQETNSNPQTVKGLFSIISLNNENGEGHKIKEINFEGEEYEASEQNITYIKSSIDMEKKYKVEFEKDQNTGLIYRVIVNSK